VSQERGGYRSGSGTVTHCLPSGRQLTVNEAIHQTLAERIAQLTKAFRKPSLGSIERCS
jgi:hypothetical protein